MSEEIKKVVNQEISDDELDMVAGGAYTEEEWNKMTTEERKAAQQRSLMIKLGLVKTDQPCEMD